MIPEKTTEILDRYFKSFIGQSRDWDFFLGLADYVKYVNTTPKIRRIIDYLLKEGSKKERELEQYKKEAIKEIEEIQNKLFRKIKQKKISYDILDKLMQRYQDYKNGKIYSFQFDVKMLSGFLEDIIKNLWENGYKEIVKDFAVEDKNKPEIIRGYTCFEKLDLYKEYDNRIKIELWRAWDYLNQVYITISKTKKEIKKEIKDWQTVLTLKKEMGMIKLASDYSIKSFMPVYFVKDEYISYATRIHNYLIQELSKEEAEKPEKGKAKEMVLYLNQSGDLYREPKERYCYPMGEKSNRHRIIRFLAMNKGYQLTKFISTELGIESEKTIRTEIGKIRNNIKKYLKIDGKDFLQGKKESGYRINPKYKITFKNE